MAQKQGSMKSKRGAKKGRTPTTKTGHRGAKRTKLDDVTKVLLGKGMYQSRKPFMPEWGP